MAVAASDTCCAALDRTLTILWRLLKERAGMDPQTLTIVLSAVAIGLSLLAIVVALASRR